MTAQGTCSTSTQAEGYLLAVWRNGRGVYPSGVESPDPRTPQSTKQERDGETPTGVSDEKTEERKLRRRTVTAWSRTLYRCYRGNTLSGQARPGRKRQKLAHENTRRTAYTGFRQSTKAATAQQTHPKGTVKHKRTGKQRRGRAQNEHISNKTHQDYIRAVADLYVF